MSQQNVKTVSKAIIGGGIIGLSTAFELRRRGHEVTVLEKELCGGQATGAAAGMLAPYSEIDEDPDDFFTMSHLSLQMYPQWQQLIRELSGHEFEYSRSGSLHVIFHEAEELALESRAAWQKAWGVQSEIVSATQLLTLEPHLSSNAVAALYCAAEHHVYAPDFVQALQEACRQIGVNIVEQTGDIHIQHVGPDSVTLAADNGELFEAEECIICSGAWTSLFADQVGGRLPVFPIRGQICAYRQEVESVQHMVFTSQGYVLGKANGTIVSGASEDMAGFDVSVTDKGINRLLKWSGKVFPFLKGRVPFHTWAGLRPATQDGYPLIGRLPHLPQIILNSGHYRNGILLSPISAALTADIVEHKTPQVDLSLVDPARFADD